MRGNVGTRGSSLCINSIFPEQLPDGGLGHGGVYGELARDGERAGAESEVEALLGAEAAHAAVDESGHEGVARAVGVGHELDGVQGAQQAAALGVGVVAALFAQAHGDAPRPAREQGLAGALDALGAVRLHVREDAELDAVGLQAEEAAREGAHFARVAGANGVEEDGRVSGLADDGGDGLRGQAGVADHGRRAAQPLAQGAHELGRHVGEDAHVRHGDEHVALLVEDGDVAARSLARDGQDLGDIDARGGGLAQDHLAVEVRADGGDQAGADAEAGEVFQHIARDAAGGGAQAAGVGIAHDDGRAAFAVDVDIRRADAEDVGLRHLNTSRIPYYIIARTASASGAGKKSARREKCFHPGGSVI